MSTVISVENVSKRYRLGMIGGGTLRADLDRWWARMRRAPDPLLKIGQEGGGNRDGELIWALRDVSFTVRQGEVLGVIGRNGAGKSTLLKIMSRVTAPTSGQIKVKGRIASLLEVGTGFHPELTGRENVYLNGTILGMTRAEIDRKFDEIVAFAELERFIDTPVKRYSSGMYVRLAFAVAAHLEPEILLVDEVLAVGDVAFQRRCLGKMENVAREGRTVLYVSHNMPSVTALCPRAILLRHGQVELDGPTRDIVSAYLRGGRDTTAEKTWLDLATAPGNEIVRLRGARVRTEDGQVLEAFDIRRPIGVEMEFDVLQQGHVMSPNCHFYTDTGTLAFVAADHSPEWRNRPRPEGRYISTCWIPGNLLSEGQMIVNVALTTVQPKRVHFHEQGALAFHVIDSADGTTARGEHAGHIPGVVRPLLKWTSQFCSEIEPLAGIAR